MFPIFKMPKQNELNSDIENRAIRTEMEAGLIRLLLLFCM